MQAFGESFVHRGDPVMRPPPYVDPYELLNKEAVNDPMRPFKR